VFAIPLPGPNAILGALLGIAMATGYEVTDRVLARRAGVGPLDSSLHETKTEAATAPAASGPVRP
jgi:hypothetical protein